MSTPPPCSLCTQPTTWEVWPARPTLIRKRPRWTWRVYLCGIADPDSGQGRNEAYTEAEAVEQAKAHAVRALDEHRARCRIGKVAPLSGEVTAGP
jgi:hypothetical protein